MHDTPIVKAKDIDAKTIFDGVKCAKLSRGQKYPKDRQTGEKYQYLDMITAFDIETSKIEVDGKRESFMYHWQWQFGDKYTVLGRTWDEYLNLVNDINKTLHDMGGIRLMCYVHNLAFEFQFISGIWHFEEADIFATDVRSPLYCKMDRIEMRCSERLSNYSLENWSKELKPDHPKLAGDLDYTIVRYSWTELTEQELAYCVNDVMCVVECVQAMLDSYKDTLYSIPYTNTGYIRRRVRQALKMWCPEAVKEMQSDLLTYDRLRQAFRGGDTHANVNYIGEIKEVYSYDRSSSYPDVIVHCKFPMSRFRYEEPTFDRFQKLLDMGRCCILKVRFLNLSLINKYYGMPYIPVDKCTEVGFTKPVNAIVDNGRIRSADYCEMAMTDIDMDIIQHQYKWDSIDIEWLESARYGFLPQPLVDVVIQLYKAKTSLKGVAEKAIEYAHSKGEINATYGMMVQRIITNPILYNGGNWKIDPDFNREEEYNKVVEKAFLNYAWGVWVTAHARYRLHEAIWLCDSMQGKSFRSPFVYADTDSIKSTVQLDFTKINNARIRDAKASGAWALDPKGKPHYMGVFEYEEDHSGLFKTLGAKRYCLLKDDTLEITVAGVPKKKGGEVLQRDGGIEAFNFDYVFKDIGKTAAIYDDDIDQWIEVDGKPLHITRNVTIINVDYDMKLYKSYAQMLALAQSWLDRVDFTDYNKRW